MIAAFLRNLLAKISVISGFNVLFFDRLPALPAAASAAGGRNTRNMRKERIGPVKEAFKGR